MAWIEAPLIVFLVIVVPVWLFLHYRSKRTDETGADAVNGDGEVAELWQTTRRMEERIRTLERILDADTPSWRGRI